MAASRKPWTTTWDTAIDMAEIPRLFPQFGGATWNLARPRELVSQGAFSQSAHECRHADCGCNTCSRIRHACACGDSSNATRGCLQKLAQTTSEFPNWTTAVVSEPEPRRPSPGGDLICEEDGCKAVTATKETPAGCGSAVPPPVPGVPALPQMVDDSAVNKSDGRCHCPNDTCEVAPAPGGYPQRGCSFTGKVHVTASAPGTCVYVASFYVLPPVFGMPVILPGTVPISMMNGATPALEQDVPVDLKGGPRCEFAQQNIAIVMAAGPCPPAGVALPPPAGTVTCSVELVFTCLTCAMPCRRQV